MKKGSKMTLEQRQKVSEGHKGLVMSEETRHRMSLAKKGQKKPPRSAEHCRKLGLYWKGRKQSEETVQKRVQKLLGENHWYWKGDNVGYRGLHIWVQKTLGKPKKCEHCHRDNLEGRLIDWANKSHQYKRNIDDWIRLCRSCHRKYDHATSK